MSSRPSVRERLLDAADALLFAEGAVATPVDVIVKRAGASPASLYAQFGSKDGLIAAALERRLTAWVDSWDQALAEAGNDEERLLSIFEGLRLYQRDKLTERWCAFSGTAASIPHPTAAIADVLARETALLQSRLLALAEPVAHERAAELARGLVITYNGALTMMLRQPWEHAIDEGEAVARMVVRMFTAPSTALPS